MILEGRVPWKEASMDASADVEHYLAALPVESRAALEELRRNIRAAAAGATETISYGMPAFKDNGRSLVAYGAFKDHCSFFPMSTTVIEAHEEELKPFQTGKGTIRFSPDSPLPAALVQKLVEARLEENAVRDRRRGDGAGRSRVERPVRKP